MPLARICRAFLACDLVRTACRRGIFYVVRIWRSTSRRLAEQTLALWPLALRLEHAQEDARIWAEPMELLGVVQAKSDQSLKACDNGDHQFVWIARCYFACRLCLDDELPKLNKKALAAPADQFSNIVRNLIRADHLIEQLKEFQMITPVFDQLCN